MNTLELDPYLQKQVDAGSSGTDILHGHLKVLMLGDIVTGKQIGRAHV